MQRYLVLILLLLMPHAVWAEPPRVVADIAPVHSLVTIVMQGAGEPTLLLPASASPHDYALRPSDALTLQNADFVFWIGPALTPWLEKPLISLSNSSKIALLEAPETNRQTMRTGGVFDQPDRDPHSTKSPSEHEIAGHEHDEEHHDGHDGHDDEDAGKHTGHGRAGEDPHAWLDPENARAWLLIIAGALAKADPENAALYHRNAENGRQDLSRLIEMIRARAALLTDASLIVDHDAFAHFEHRFGFEVIGAISDGHAVRPGAQRIGVLRDLLQRTPETCILISPETPESALVALTSGLDVQILRIDPLGAELTPGSALYAQMVGRLADQFLGCGQR